jgi:hypothetical protein
LVAFLETLTIGERTASGFLETSHTRDRAAIEPG